MGDTFGRLFRVTTFGESHGPAIGCVIDGCPPGLPLDAEALAPDLARRKPGQSLLTSQRREEDLAQILSGTFEGATTGTSIAILIPSTDARSQDYDALADLYRPSHADFTYDAKYGRRDPRGGGRASARETAARVAAGAVARRLLSIRAGVEVVGYVSRVADVAAAPQDPRALRREQVDANAIRCPDENAATKMMELVEAARRDGDSVGGVVECFARGLPAGWGEPVFDKLDADLAKAMLSIPAAKGFEIGSGFDGTKLRGSTHNDPFVNEGGKIRAPSNRAGGVLGGISTGEPIVVRVAFKPTATIMKTQKTVNRRGEPVEFAAKGRHDPCVLPRAVPIVEAMTCLVLADHFLRHEGQCGPRARGAPA